jgi:biotin transporter BioY
VITIVILLITHHYIPAIQSHAGFSYMTTGMFVLFCVIAFILSKKAVKSANKYRFIHILLMIIMGKMFLSLVMVLAYVKLFNPTDKLFVIPFFLIYLVFTAFEIYFLEKVAKEDEQHDLQGNHQ